MESSTDGHEIQQIYIDIAAISSILNVIKKKMDILKILRDLIRLFGGCATVQPCNLSTSRQWSLPKRKTSGAWSWVN